MISLTQNTGDCALVFFYITKKETGSEIKEENDQLVQPLNTT